MPGEPCLPAFRPDPDRIHAGAADDHHAPARRRAGTKGGERVVPDLDPAREGLRFDRIAQQANIVRKVRAGETEAADLDRRRCSGKRASLSDQVAQPLHGGLDGYLLV